MFFNIMKPTGGNKLDQDTGKRHMYDNWLKNLKAEKLESLENRVPKNAKIKNIFYNI